MQNLESLSRSQLQALIKEYGLKGANKKTGDLQNILKEYYLLTPSPSLNEISETLESMDVSQEPKIVSEEPLQEELKEDMQEKVIQEEPPLIDRVNSEKENLKDQLLAHLSQDSVRILQEQELLDWDLLKSLEFKDLSDLGMKMSTFLKLRNLLNEKFPGKSETMIPLSEIKSIVHNILQVSVIPNPTLSTKVSETVEGWKKNAVKKPGKYDNVKSKVAQQWNKKL